MAISETILDIENMYFCHIAMEQVEVENEENWLT